MVTGRQVNILIDYFEKESNSAELRLEVLKVLLDKRINHTVQSLEEVMANHWDKKDTQLEFFEKGAVRKPPSRNGAPFPACTGGCWRTGIIIFRFTASAAFA